MRNASEEKNMLVLTTYLDARIFRQRRDRKFTLKRSKGNSHAKERTCYSNVFHREAMERDNYATAGQDVDRASRVADSPGSNFASPRLENLMGSRSIMEVPDQQAVRMYRTRKTSCKQSKLQLKLMKEYQPYVQNANSNMVRLVLQHLKPVSGPNESIRQSISRHKQSNIQNVEVVIKNLKFDSFEEMMAEFARRSALPADTRFFVCNSKERFVKAVLESWGWVENKNRASNFYHLKWVYSDASSDYHELQTGQLFNHFDRNKELTNKNCLQKHLRKKAHKQVLMPPTYDLESCEERDMFEAQFQRQMVFSFLKIFVRQVSKHRSDYFRRLTSGRLLCTEATRLLAKHRMAKRPLTSKETLLTVFNDRLLVDPHTTPDFVFPVHLLLLICRYCRFVIDTETGATSRGMFSHNPKEWMRHRMAVHRYLSHQPTASVHLPKLESPSQLLIFQLLKVQLVLSCLFRKEWISYGSSNLWVAKPVGVSRGTGIAIHQDREKLLESVKQTSKLVQKYIERPLMFRDTPVRDLGFCLHRKFDLRQWILVTSLNPLQAYRFDRCYVRLCSQKYNVEDFANHKQHLTNYSQNKSFFNRKEQSVLSQEQLQLLLGDADAWRRLDRKIVNIYVKTLQAVHQDMVQNSSCFELYGFDVIIDQQMEPWLLEVNLSPACQQRTQWMKQYVQQMAEGMLRIVLPEEMRPQPTSDEVYYNHWRRIIRKDSNALNPKRSVPELALDERATSLIRRLQLRCRVLSQWRKRTSGQHGQWKSTSIQRLQQEIDPSLL